VGCWRGYLSGARCRLAYGPADATATHCLLLQKISVQCFDTVGWMAGRASSLLKTEQWGAGVVVAGARCKLAYGPADATATHCLLAKSRLVLPFWYQLTRVVPEKGPLNGSVCVYYVIMFSLRPNNHVLY